MEVYLLITLTLGLFVHLRDSRDFIDYINPRIIVKHALVGLIWPVVVMNWIFNH